MPTRLQLFRKRCGVFLCGALSAGGCAETARQVAKEATPGGLEGGLEAMSKPVNQQRLNALLDSAAVERVGERAARGAMRGVLGGDEMQGFSADSLFKSSQFRGGTTRLVVEPVIGIAESDAAPAAARFAGSTTRPSTKRLFLDSLVRETELWAHGMIRSATSGGIRDALSEPGPGVQNLTNQILDAAGNRLQTEVSGDRLGPTIRAMIADQIGPGVGEAVRKDIGPAINSVLKNDLGPAVREMIQQEIRPALNFSLDGGQLRKQVEGIAAESARAAAREAVLGVDDALRKLDEDAKQGRPGSSLLARTQTAVRTGINFFQIVAIVLGLAVIALGAWLAIVLVKVRRSRIETSKREEAAERLAGAIRAAAERPWGPELNALLRERLGPQNDAILGPATAPRRF